MTLSVFNTMGSRKEPFVPLVPGKVRMYVCGVTVYDLCHIGHARAQRGVRHHRPLPSVRRLRRHVSSGTSPTSTTRSSGGRTRRAVADSEVAEATSRRSREDLRRLRLSPADVEPKATEHIPEMIALIERLVAKGLAYPVATATSTSRVDSASPTTASCPARSLDEMQAGARDRGRRAQARPAGLRAVEGAQAGRARVGQPVGRRAGRAGTSSARRWRASYLGEPLRHPRRRRRPDLPAPRERDRPVRGAPRASRSRATGCTTACVNLGAEKMSKSLGNFFTPAGRPGAGPRRRRCASSCLDALPQPARLLRRALDEAKRAWTGCYRVKERGGQPALARPSGAGLGAARRGRGRTRCVRPQRFEAAMDDDFNTAAALGHLFDAVRALNRLAPAEPSVGAGEGGSFPLRLRHPRPAIHRPGLAPALPRSIFPGQYTQEARRRENGSAPRPQTGSSPRSRRDGRTRGKQYAEADRIRKELEAAGVLLEDGKAARPGNTRTKVGSTFQLAAPFGPAGTSRGRSASSPRG